MPRRPPELGRRFTNRHEKDPGLASPQKLEKNAETRRRGPARLRAALSRDWPKPRLSPHGRAKSRFCFAGLAKATKPSP